MSAETQAKVFEPFFTTKGVGKGTGLGLSTVFGLVREFGGHIEVESGLGVGSCFRLTFPRSDQASAPAPDAVARSTYQHGGKIVLLVEDEPLVRAGVRHLLQELGYTVLVADHPAKALDLCSDAVDLLLTDIVMPGTNGPELAQELRSRFPRLRVLFMSAYSDEVLVDQGRIAPGQPVLEKPFEEHELAAMVRRALAAGPPAS
jgi:CheY-like chemotaxis protein